MINTIKLEEERVQNFPNLLTENPDAFAKKMRILKLDILGLERGNVFSSNEYCQFWITSPATLMAKKQFCINNRINFRNSLNVLRYSWRELIRRVDNTLNDEEASEKGKRLTNPFKQKYDEWMRAYKKWAGEFAIRRGRRLIKRV